MTDLRRSLARWHRLTALTLSPVFVVLLVTGAILAFRPMLATPAPVAPAVDVAHLLSLLTRIDSAGTLRVVGISEDARVAMVGRGREMPTAYDIATGAIVPLPAEAAVNFYDRIERIHRNLWLGLGGLVTLAAFALLFQVLVGPFLAPLRSPRTILTWHSAVGWVLWPLAVLVPLTAVLIQLPLGRPLGPRRGASAASAIPMVESLRQADGLAGISHLGLAQRLPDGSLIFITSGPEGDARRMLHDGKISRLDGGFAQFAHRVHTGEWGGVWGGVVDLGGVLVLVSLLTTGLWSWWRRR